MNLCYSLRMDKIKNVLICGLGAIGSIYAVKIKGFADLRILADSERIKRYEKTPVCFNGVPYRFDYILPEDKGFKADLIILATKSHGLSGALKNIENFVTDDTVILSLLNGISSEEEIAAKYGNKVLYSYFVGHTSTRNKENVTFDGVGEIVFGEKDNTVLSRRVLSVKEFFDDTRINYTIPEDMEYSMWKKFLVNVGTNQASAILGGDYFLFQNSCRAMAFAKNLMREAQKAAEMLGVKNTDRMLDEAVEIINSMLPETKSSMLQDVDAKRVSEVDIFAGKVVELCANLNIPAPYNSMALEIIKAIDEKSVLNS